MPTLDGHQRPVRAQAHASVPQRPSVLMPAWIVGRQGRAGEVGASSLSRGEGRPEKGRGPDLAVRASLNRPGTVWS